MIAGDKIRFALKFAPKRVFVELLDEQDARVLAKELSAEKSSSLTVPGEVEEGVVLQLRVDAANGRGDVTYMLRLDPTAQ